MHGSGVFTRGETQVLSIATLAPVSEAQVIEGLGTETSERYMHNYNMPPYSTGRGRAVSRAPAAAKSAMARWPSARLSR